MAYQTRDVIETMSREASVSLKELRVDGGAAMNDFLCRFQADQLDVIVKRSAIAETTALGASFLAGLAEGVWASTDEIAKTWQQDAEFAPSRAAGERDRLYAGWKRAVERSRGWARGG
jgi:glycerol kinase